MATSERASSSACCSSNSVAKDSMPVRKLRGQQHSPSRPENGTRQPMQPFCGIARQLDEPVLLGRLAICGLWHVDHSAIWPQTATSDGTVTIRASPIRPISPDCDPPTPNHIQATNAAQWPHHVRPSTLSTSACAMGFGRDVAGMTNDAAPAEDGDPDRLAHQGDTPPCSRLCRGRSRTVGRHLARQVAELAEPSPSAERQR